jgi:hypothetical protein
MNQRLKQLAILAAVAVVVFLGGFLPQYMSAHALRQQVEQANLRLEMCRVLDLSGMTFLETSLKNYGLAGRYASQWFEAAKALAAQTSSPELRQKLNAVLAKRDGITARLARGDEAAYSSVQAAYQILLTNALGAPAN